METKKMTYMQAVRLALDEEMARDEKVIMMGQDIGILGGAYGVTGDLYHKYGPIGSLMRLCPRMPLWALVSARP